MRKYFIALTSCITQVIDHSAPYALFIIGGQEKTKKMSTLASSLEVWKADIFGKGMYALETLL